PARGLRVRLVIDAFDGGVISRTRLDAPLLPPREVGRERAPRLDPYRPYPPEEIEEAELPPRALGRAPGRGFVDREDLPPPPLTQPRRGDLPPPALEPRPGGVSPPEAPPPGQRQARRPEG